MIFLWLGFMVLFVAALVLPLAQELDFGRDHLIRAFNVLFGIAGILIGAVLVTVFLAYVGFQSYGTGGALVLGFAGALSSLLLAGVLSVVSASREERADTEIL